MLKVHKNEIMNGIIYPRIYVYVYMYRQGDRIVIVQNLYVTK